MKPILFNQEMVKAILDGRKTVTRRIVKPQPDNKHQSPLGYVMSGISQENEGCFGWGLDEYGGTIQHARPPYKVGDILYVRETWCRGTVAVGELEDGRGEEFISQCDAEKDYVIPKEWAIRNNIGIEDILWKPSIHMPKVAARIFLRVKTVRAERLMEMSIQDMIDEGINTEGIISNQGPINYQVINRFEELWNSTIKKEDFDNYSLGANPWVWVIEFERVKV